MTSPRHLDRATTLMAPTSTAMSALARSSSTSAAWRCLALLPIPRRHGESNDARILHDHTDAGGQLLNKVNVTGVHGSDGRCPASKPRYGINQSHYAKCLKVRTREADPIRPRPPAATGEHRPDEARRAVSQAYAMR